MCFFDIFYPEFSPLITPKIWYNEVIYCTPEIPHKIRQCYPYPSRLTEVLPLTIVKPTKGGSMKILHCLAQLPMKTGSGVYFSTVVNAMVHRNHENAVIYAEQPPFAINFEGVQKHYPVEFLTRELPFPIAGMSDEMPYPSTVYSKMDEEMTTLWHDAFRRRLRLAKEEFRPDVVICHHLFLLTALVREVFPDTKLIGITHGTDLRQVRKHPRFRNHLSAIPTLDAFCSIAPKDAHEIRDIFGVAPSKIEVMGGGFNSEIFYEGRDEVLPGLNLMYAGKISPSKGVFELAKATPLIAEKYPYVKVHIVGAADEETKKELYRLAGGEENLAVYNAENQKLMADQLRKMDVFVLPSYYEGLGLVAIEALACSVRTVATEIEGLMWLLGKEVADSGVIEYVALPKLYDVDKPYEEEKPAFVRRLADKLLLQLDRIIAQESFPEEIKKEVRNHSWDHIMDRLEQRLQSLL